MNIYIVICIFTLCLVLLHLIINHSSKSKTYIKAKPSITHKTMAATINPTTINPTTSTGTANNTGTTSLGTTGTTSLGTTKVGETKTSVETKTEKKEDKIGDSVFIYPDGKEVSSSVMINPHSYEDLICAVCLHIFDDPVMLNKEHSTPTGIVEECGHRYCRKCITRVKTTAASLGNEFKCPRCSRTPSLTEFRPDMNSKYLIAKLSVVCPYACGWRCEFGDRGKDLRRHTDSCDKRGDLCAQCKERVETGKEAIHATMCPDGVVKCPISEKCDVSMARRDFYDHMQNCGYQDVQCDLKYLGCDWKGYKMDYKEHTINAMDAHMSLARVKYDEVEKEKKDGRDKYLNLEGEIKRWKQELENAKQEQKNLVENHRRDVDRRKREFEFGLEKSRSQCSTLYGRAEWVARNFQTSVESRWCYESGSYRLCGNVWKFGAHGDDLYIVSRANVNATITIGIEDHNKNIIAAWDWKDAEFKTDVKNVKIGVLKADLTERAIATGNLTFRIVVERCDGVHNMWEASNLRRCIV